MHGYKCKAKMKMTLYLGPISMNELSTKLFVLVCDEESLSIEHSSIHSFQKSKLELGTLNDQDALPHCPNVTKLRF